jgi:hypothetical protein
VARVRLADDARGRVPFALIGVLLLVGASTYAVTLDTRGPSGTDRRVDAAVDRATAASWSAARASVRAAARDAAATPAVRPANTTFGRVVNESSPFRDVLRIRAYVAARRAVASTARRQGDVRVSVSLPPADNASRLRAAKRRVSLAGRANGTGMRVRIRGVRIRVHRDGRVVSTDRRALTVTVATPVLAMHERTERYERRLNAELDDPGLARRLSARLWPIVWARGYAQRYGAPIGNVLGTRHVDIATNGAVLAVQRSTFGREDPAGRHGYRRALVRASLQAATSEVNAGSAWVHAVVADPNQPPDSDSPELDVPAPDGVDESSAGNRSRPNLADGAAVRVEGAATARPVNASVASPERTLSADVGETADRAFVRFQQGANGSSLRAVVNRAYDADVRLATALEETVAGDRPAPVAPGPDAGVAAGPGTDAGSGAADGRANWTLIDTDVETTAYVAPAEAPDPDVPDGWVGFAEFERRVTRTHEVTWTWRSGRARTRTSGHWVDRHRVGVTVLGRPTPPDRVPPRPIDPVFRRGGPLDGPNLRDVPDRAAERLLGDRGGRDAVAAAAVAGDLNRTARTVRGRRPAGLVEWVRADIADLRRRVRNVSVNVSRGAVATTEAAPSKRLLEKLETRRPELIGAAESYDGAADRARAAARAAYLDRVLGRLRAQADRKETVDAEIGGVLEGLGSSLGELEAARQARTRVESPERGGVDGLAGRVRLIPDGGPSYLTTAGVEDSHLPAVARGSEYRPLATVNVNPFTVPYEQLAQEVLDAALPLGGRVPLHQAAATLIAANESLRVGVSVPKLRDHRDELRAGVARSLRVYERRSEGALAEATNLSAADREAAVAAALARWNDTGRRGVAAANGSLATAVAAEAAARGAADRDALAVRLGVVHLDAALDGDTSVARPAVSRTKSVAVNALKSRVTEAATNEVGRTLARKEAKHFGKRFASMPAGLPVAPVAGQWYFTFNVWVVRVRGAYARFAVRTERGRASAAGSETRYVREDAPVEVDVDGDGDRERLGWNERLTFSSGTVVGIAVPPYGNGVGDTGGMVYETSAGWPTPGCVRNGTCFPTRERPPATDDGGWPVPAIAPPDGTNGTAGANATGPSSSGRRAGVG